MEYRYSPKPKNKNALCFVTGLFALSALFLAFGMGDLLSLRAVWHFLFLISAVSMLFVFLRYHSSSYVYTVTDALGEPMLIVSHVQGRRLSTHCRLSLSRLLRLVEVPDPESAEGRAALADFRAERVRYSYLATIGKASTQILYGREGGRRFAIRIEGDEAFLSVLREAAARAASYATEEEDDDEA